MSAALEDDRTLTHAERAEAGRREHVERMKRVRQIHVLKSTDRYGYGSLEVDDIKVGSIGCYVGVVPIGRSARQVSHGPLVPGPWGYVGRHATVISAHPMPEPPAPRVEVGDLLVIDQVVYRLIVNPRSRSLRDSDHFTLEVVDDGQGA